MTSFLPAYTARFAPVVPLRLQDQLTREGLMGNYHLLLAHLILQEPDSWATYYADFYNSHPDTDSFVMMDNSLIELGYSLEPEEILEAATIVKADALVLPDTLLNMEATIESSVRAAKLLGWPPDNCKYLAVVQGNDLTEIETCITRFIQEIPHLGYLSIPRVIHKALGSRLPAIQLAARLMAELGIQYPIHLLGFSEDVHDDFLCTHHPDVMGIDSAMPIWASMKGIVLGTDTHYVRDLGGRPLDYMDQKSLGDEDLTLTRVKLNLGTVREWLENPRLQSDFENYRIVESNPKNRLTFLDDTDGHEEPEYNGGWVDA